MPSHARQIFLPPRSVHQLVDGFGELALINFLNKIKEKEIIYISIWTITLFKSNFLDCGKWILQNLHRTFKRASLAGGLSTNGAKFSRVRISEQNLGTKFRLNFFSPQARW
jgi:hypothetical protein